MKPKDRICEIWISREPDKSFSVNVYDAKSGKMDDKLSTIDILNGKVAKQVLRNTIHNNMNIDFVILNEQKFA